MPRGKTEKTLELITQARAIYKAIHPASVRAGCYQLFVRKLIPSMKKSVTNWVGVQLRYARENGIIPWEWIVDDTRQTEEQPGWQDKEEFKSVMAGSYCLQRWLTQPIRVEVWSEKATVRGTLAPVLEKYGVGFLPVHGFSSVTVVHDVVMRQQKSNAAPLTIIYVGDHDPSGLYMSSVDLPSRIARMWELSQSPYDLNISIEHVALNTKDCRSLPSFPAKQSDSRCKWYVKHYGHKAWELDAMSPAILRRRVEAAILRQPIDWEAWQRVELCSQAEQASLENVLSAWAELKESIPVPAQK